MVQEELAVEVIHFMAEGTGEQVGALDKDFFAFQIQATQHDLLGPDHICGKSRNAEAAFLFELFPFSLYYFGIDQRKQMVFLFATGRVRPPDAFRYTNLWGR